MSANPSKESTDGWWVVATKPRGETKAKDHLEAQGMSTYLPMMQREIIRGGLRRVEMVPLFSRYLFLLNNAKAKASVHNIRSTRGVSQLLMSGDRPAIAEDMLVEAIQSLVDKTQEIDQNYFKSGDLVRVINGPFSGLEGIYKMDNGDLRSMVLIEFMQKKHSLGFEKTQLRKR